MDPSGRVQWEVSGRTSLSADVVHDLVFSLPRDAGVREEHLQHRSEVRAAQQPEAAAAQSTTYRHVPPARVVAQPVGHVVPQTLGQVVHELCSLQKEASRATRQPPQETYRKHTGKD